MREERWINITDLIGKIGLSIHRAQVAGMNPDDLLMGVMAEVNAWVEKQPDQPPLVGLVEAANILDVPKPRVSRYKNRGDLQPIKVDGRGADVYLRNEIEAYKSIVDGRRIKPRKPSLTEMAAHIQMYQPKESK